MPQIRYKVTLTEPERQMLQELATHGRHSSQKLLNALILLGCDEGPCQEKKMRAQQLADVLPVSLKKIDRVKRRFVEDGLDVALEKRKPERQYSKKADGTSRPTWWRSAARSLPKERPAGPSGCWRTRWWNWDTWMRSLTRRYAGC